MTTTVNDIEHIESQSYTGVSVTRVYFQPNAKVEVALSQVTAIAQTLLRIFPPGTTPPNIIKYDASSVPILQLGLESKTLSEQEIFDLGQNFIRTQLATIQGAAVPLPYGGKFRAGDGGPESGRAVRQGPFARRMSQRVRQPEPDSAGGHRQDRRQGLPGQAQQQPAHPERDERHCRSRW